MDADVFTGAVPETRQARNFKGSLIPLDSYAVGLNKGPIANPSAQGVRVWINVDNVITGNGAAATAVLTGDAVSGSTDLEGGEGYGTAPDIEVTGDGTGATAHAVLTGDSMTSIVIDTGGTAYTHAEFVFTGGGTAGNIKIEIDQEETSSSIKYNMLQTGAITTTGLKGPYTVDPRVATAANVSKQMHPGTDFYIHLVHSAAGLWRYNVMVELLN